MSDSPLLPPVASYAAPMKKTHQYYSFRENLWNHTYFTCPKVASFFQKPQQDFYKNHPTEEQVRDMEQSERQERKEQRMQMARSMDFSRLHRRKLERQILQSRSKQPASTQSLPVSESSSLDSSAFTMTVYRPAPSPQVERNKWNDLNPLPVTQIRKFLPKYELDLDAKATAMLLAKRAHYQAVQQAKEARKRQIRDEERQKLAQRHQATEELERKSGVLKYRANLDPMASTVSSQSSVGPYGFMRTSQHSPRSEAFAQPRSLFLPKDPLLYSEFRGLIQRDNPEAVRKMRTMFSSRASTLSGSQLSLTELPRPLKASLPSTPKSIET